MNTTQRSPLDDEKLDRLVDDELNESERRDLFTRFENEPGGWRRCALAFLEAQCWRKAMAAIPQATADAHQAVVRPRGNVRSKWTHRVGTAMAMAASFLLVFWIGSLAQRGRVGSPVNNFGGQLATHEPFTPPAASPWRTVAVSDQSGRPPISTIRAIERDGIDDQWVNGLPSAMPENVRQAFQRTGHQIEQHRQLVPVSLQDGRRLLVPVDQVDVNYIGNGSY